MSFLHSEKNAPWKRRYRATVIYWAQIARTNPERGVVSSNKTGTSQLYAWAVNSGKLHQLTNIHEGIVLGFISPDGNFVYYFKDNGGDEMGHWVRLPYKGGMPEDITPSMPVYSSFGLSISHSGNTLGFTAGMDDGFHVFVMTLSGGKIGVPSEVYVSQKMIFGPTLAGDGKIAVITSTERSIYQRQSLIVLDITTGEKINELRDGEQSGLMAWRFSPLKNDYRLLATTNRTGATRPFIWNPVSGFRKDLTLNALPGDIAPLDWSNDSKRILLSQSLQAVQQLMVYDTDTETSNKLQHPPGAYSMNTYFAADTEIFALWENSTTATRLIALDAKTGVKTRTVLSSGEAPSGHPWRSIHFTSSDGQPVQGWLGLPTGIAPFPTILHTHGGPEVMTTDSYIPSSQAWLDHGFAFLAINYRGSSGFGKAFREKIWGDLGHWEIEDMVAARQWLIEQGIANPRQVFLTGWSYGGYLTLLALGKAPDLWAGGLAGMATTDWAAEYDDLSPILKAYSVAMMGGTPQEKPEQYAKSSPITYAANVIAPVLIIQGRNDTRTPARPVVTYAKKLKSLGKKVEVHWYDAGHSGGGIVQDIKHMALMLRFAFKIMT